MSDTTPTDDPTADDDWTPEPRYTPGTADMILASQRAAETREREKSEANRPTGTEISQLTGKLRKLSAQLAQLVAFLTGARGYASNSASWADSNANGGHTDFTFTDYDPAYDAHVDFEGPESGIISVDLTAWLDVKANAYSADASKPYGVNVRGGVSFDIVDAAGAVAYDVRQGDGVRLTTEAYGSNNANVIGATTSNTIMVSGLTPGTAYTLRTRRGRYGYAHDGDSNPITMPSGGWWTVLVQDIRIQVQLVAGATVTDQTPADDYDDSNGGS